MQPLTCFKSGVTSKYFAGDVRDRTMLMSFCQSVKVYMTFGRHDQTQIQTADILSKQRKEWESDTESTIDRRAVCAIQTHVRLFIHWMRTRQGGDGGGGGVGGEEMGGWKNGVGRTHWPSKAADFAMDQEFAIRVVDCTSGTVRVVGLFTDLRVFILAPLCLVVFWATLL